MTLSVGDSFILNYSYPPIAVVDSVYFITGRKYIRFKYNISGAAGDEGKLLFIEGIGATTGILFQHYPLNTILLCKFMDGQKEYSNLFFGGRCWVFFGGINDKKSNQSLSIFPNPFNGVLNISFNEVIHEKINIRIVNILGETVYSSEFENIIDKNIPLNNLNLNPGIYFIQINGETFRVSKKVMCSK